MKKIGLSILLTIYLTFSVIAQTIDISQYQPTTLEDYLFIQGTGEAIGKKYCFSVYYNDRASSGTTLYFDSKQNFTGKTFWGTISRRYALEHLQLVTVYVTCQSSFSSIINDIVAGNISIQQTKPWQPFISNGRSGLHGWYLEDLGNGTYREVYYE
jgi:hypothetical protein